MQRGEQIHWNLFQHTHHAKSGLEGIWAVHWSFPRGLKMGFLIWPRVFNLWCEFCLIWLMGNIYLATRLPQVRYNA